MHPRFMRGRNAVKCLTEAAGGRLDFFLRLLGMFAFCMVFLFQGDLWAQTREDCNKCCKDTFSDEYYAEQCRLKCFRDSGHCSGLKASRTPAASRDQSEQQAPRREIVKPDPPPPRPDTRPPQETAVQKPAPPPKRPPAFRWPETLVLTPGREWEAAGQILAANGIPPQHPNFTAGMKAIEGVLTDFARRNPGGGDLPVDQLERILAQLRR
jgi:hypothetical protein